MTSLNTRALAAQIMLQVVDEQKSLTGLLANADVPADNKALLQSLCFGGCRHFFSINALSKMLLDKPLPESARPVQALLWVGLYQLAHSEISQHAAIHETVEACQQLNLGKFKGVLNAILRRFQREQEDLMAGLKNSDVPHYEHPKWFIKLLKKSWPDHWQKICDNGNRQAPMCLRVNTNSQTTSEYLLSLGEANIEARQAEHSLTGLYLQQAQSVFDLPEFELGSCSVQDEAAQLAAQILAPQKGERILDACAAPGGKTCHILEAVHNQAQLTAIDADAKRLLRIEENLERLKLTAKVVHGEAQSPENWWDGQAFDRILLDVPCSATGVIRRHPDIKLLRQKEDIANLASLQQNILQKTWDLLKPGGTLLYATCSILPMENSENIQQFLQHQTDAQLQPISLQTGLDTGYGWQLFPDKNSHDGFFYALLKKSDVGSQVSDALV